MKAICFVLIFSLAAYGYSYAQMITPGIDSNTVALWHFDEGNGNILHDATSYHNDGTIYNCEWVQGRFGSALHFNGLTSYVLLPNSLSLTPATEFTIEAWFSLDTLGLPPSIHESEGVILSNLGPYPCGGGYQIYYDDPRGFRFDDRSAGCVSNFTNFVPLVEAHHFYNVACVYKQEDSLITISTYFDGTLSDSTVVGGSITYLQTPYFYIGTNVDGRAVGGIGVREFNGIIDEIRISKIARNQGGLGGNGISVSPPFIDFGLVGLGSSVSQRVVIANTMLSSALHVDSITCSDPHFIPSETSFDLPPLSTSNILVTYTPTTTATDTAVLKVYSSGFVSQIVSVGLRGEGFTIEQAPIIFSIKDVPDDQGKQVRIIWLRSIYDSAGISPVATEYSVWRRVDEAVQSKAVPGQLSQSILKGTPRSILVDGQLWDFIVTVPAVQFEKYSYVAPTLHNEIPLSSNWSVFRISVHTADNAFYFSAPDSGYSVDNIYPPPPLNITAHLQPGRIQLRWDASAASDVEQYYVYRSTAPTVVPSLFLRVGKALNQTFDDSTVVEDSTYYYTITAADSSGNESAQSDVSQGVFVTGVVAPSGEIPTHYFVSKNYPNPFNPVTEIQYGLPERGRVSVRIYNVLGAQVQVLLDNQDQNAGVHKVRWEPTVTSGVYFYRVEIAGAGEYRRTFRETGKMLFLK